MTRKPNVILLPSPLGVDKAIQDVQISLADGLSWLERSYGRAITQKALEPEQSAPVNVPATAVKRQVIYPECYTERQEPVNMMPNDNLQSHSFFLVRDPGTFINYNVLDEQAILQYPASVIFWFNLTRINPAKGFRYTEELKQQVMTILMSNSNITLTEVYENYDEIFREFTITETVRQYLKPPFGGFRFDFLISFAQMPENEC